VSQRAVVSESWKSGNLEKSGNLGSGLAFQRICKALVFDETFGTGSAFNAEVFVAAPHAVAMEFDLFRERWSPDASGLG
jgi:hypothetical protein